MRKTQVQSRGPKSDAFRAYATEPFVRLGGLRAPHNWKSPGARSWRSCFKSNRRAPSHLRWSARPYPLKPEFSCHTPVVLPEPQSGKVCRVGQSRVHANFFIFARSFAYISVYTNIIKLNLGLRPLLRLCQKGAHAPRLSVCGPGLSGAPLHPTERIQPSWPPAGTSSCRSFRYSVRSETPSLLASSRRSPL